MKNSQLQGIKIAGDVRFQNFIVFEPQSVRVPEQDVLIRGYEARYVFDQVMAKLSRRDTIQDLIINNRLSKIANMMSLVQNEESIVITKFLDKIWKRYSYLSNLGENFLDLKSYLLVFPEYQSQRDTLIATRKVMDDLDDGMDEETEETEGDSIESVDVSLHTA